MSATLPIWQLRKLRFFWDEWFAEPVGESILELGPQFDLLHSQVSTAWPPLLSLHYAFTLDQQQLLQVSKKVLLSVSSTFSSLLQKQKQREKWKSLVLNYELCFCFWVFQFCNPRDHQITFELFNWHLIFGGEGGIEETKCSGGENSSSGFPKASCVFSPVSLTLEICGTLHLHPSVSNKHSVSVGEGDLSGTACCFWLGEDHSGIPASPNLLGGRPEWLCRLALDINLL